MGWGGALSLALRVHVPHPPASHERWGRCLSREVCGGGRDLGPPPSAPGGIEGAPALNPAKDINPKALHRLTNGPTAEAAEDESSSAHRASAGFLCSGKWNGEIPAIVLEGIVIKWGCMFF